MGKGKTEAEDKDKLNRIPCSFGYQIKLMLCMACKDKCKRLR